MNHKILGLLMGGLTLAATASPAYAASVSVEIEGQSLQAAPVTVTTPGHVTKSGGIDCGGSTVVGALEAATGGDWAGTSYTVDVIKGEAHPFGPAGSWGIYLNGKFVNDPACTASVGDGDRLLFFWSGAYASAGYAEPVLLDAPTTAIPGQLVPVRVSETSTYFGPTNMDPGVTTISPSSGASVSGGTATATTGPDGTAQVTVAGGPYTLVASKGNRAPARISGCATTGSDGFCGTTAPASTPAAPCVTKGDDGFCGSPDKRAANAAFAGLPEGKKYKKGQGPRELKGHVADEPSGIADVRVRLTRRSTHACSTFDAKKERFVAMKRCGATHGAWFSVGAKQDFTYLLPSKLGAGRYVLDLNVVDKAGNKTAALARGTSRVVFTVG
jgi:hypothetical protein